MSKVTDFELKKSRILILGCGALAREIISLKQLNSWDHIDLKCLDASLHNRPHLIAPTIRSEIKKYKKTYEHIFIAYADCGTAGEIDEVLKNENIDRLSGAHCYETFVGNQKFEELMNEELGTFFLTDFLVMHFDRLVYRGLGLDRHKDMRDQIFGNYKRVVYLSQSNDLGLIKKAKLAAKKLNLKFFHQESGLGRLKNQLETQVLQFKS